ncbi:MAG: ferritin [Candidatus Lokiarchaeia archaeon]
MLKDKIQEALNKQIVAELYSSYLYLSMEAYFHSINLPGFANWMRVQMQEENMHGLMIFDYVAERGGKIKLGPIEGPATEWNSPLDVFEAVYAHEQKVTGLINDLVNLAIEEKDHATNNFLQWFVKEQVEEEASADAIRQKLKLIGDDGRGLLMLDQELAQRVFRPPTTAEET